MRIFLTLFLTFLVVRINCVYNCVNFTEISLENFSKHAIPSLEGKAKGVNGRILVIGSSIYFTAMAALKSGADFVTLITTESERQILKTKSSDYLVLPYLHTKHLNDLKFWIIKSQIVVYSATYPHNMALFETILNICKELQKPLVLDLYSLTLISRNISLLKNYSAGVILTPDTEEADQMLNRTGYNDWSFLDENVSVLLKGKADKFYINNTLQWSFELGGSPRRTIGQGDMLAGIVGVFYNWALRANICPLQVQSIAAYAATRLTRGANARAFDKYGRSMLASDMLEEIHSAFEDLFVQE